MFTHTNVPHKPFTMEEFKAAIDSVAGVLPAAEPPEPFALNRPWQPSPLRDELILHPNDLAVCPEAFLIACLRVGIVIKPFVYMPRHVFMLTGRAATLMQKIRFEAEVAAAMRDNHEFLKLMEAQGFGPQKD